MNSDYFHMGAIHLNDDDKKVILHLARELTGSIVSQERHGLIFLNVSNRIQDTHCHTLSQYLQFVHAHEKEIPFLLSALTIHTTGWFREPMTFDQFQAIALEFARKNPAGTFRLLSIGCSSGEEIYSYAFILEEVKRAFPLFNYQLEGLDIDPVSLSQGRAGLYSKVRPEFVEERWRHLLLRRLRDGDTVKVEPKIMAATQFRSANILQFEPVTEQFDFISCRNTLIYFDTTQIDSILAKVTRMLRPEGYFCTGVSETGVITRPELKSQGSTIFQLKMNQKDARVITRRREAAPVPMPTQKSAETVFIIDDESELLEMYLGYLNNEFKSVVSATRYEEALAKMMGFPGGFAVIDYNLGGGRTGLDLLAEARSRGFRGDFILLSGFADEKIASKAHELGCKDVVLKPCRPDELVTVIKRFAGITPPVKPEIVVLPELLAFGSSTGGTEILIKILDHIPQPCPPVVVVQHIVSDFAADFAQRLAEKSGLTLGKIVDGEVLRPNHLYMSLGDYHIMVRKSGGLLRLGISNADPISSHRPSVDFLFDSIAQYRVRTVATILTGMGRDGAEGMAKIHARGGFTMAQDESSSTVFGMPGEAIKLGVVDLIGNPRQIQMKIHSILGVQKRFAS